MNRKIGINDRLCANLIRLRLNAGWDQNCLERKSGVPNISQIESGARPAGKQALSKLAKALGVDIYELFLPEDVRVVKDHTDKLFLDVISACSLEGQKFVLDLIINFMKYEKRKNFKNGFNQN